MHPAFRDVTSWGYNLCLGVNKIFGFIWGQLWGRNYSETLRAGPPTCSVFSSFVFSFNAVASGSGSVPGFSWLLASAVRTRGKNDGFPKGSHGSGATQNCEGPDQLPVLAEAHFPHLQNGNNCAFLPALIVVLS